MKLIKTTEAAGHVLCHDITKIVPGTEKGARFRKGHVVTEEDIPELLSMGKENLYVWEKKEGMLHEDEAAQVLCEICMGRGDSHRPNMKFSEAREGKIEIIATCEGLFKLNRQGLMAVNAQGEMMIATRRADMLVRAGDKLAGMRVIPLVIAEEKMMEARKAAGAEPLFQVIPLKRKKIGIVTTGTEVSSGRITDAFGPVVRHKAEEFQCEILGQTILGDSRESIAAEIRRYINLGAEMVICTGGMSVDPDDTTPSAIRSIGAEIISYGAPVLPGAMLMLAYYGSIPVLGLPGCVMYAKRTVFDLILPRLLADDRITAEELVSYGEGGLCLGCNTCHYPNCQFGK